MAILIGSQRMHFLIVAALFFVLISDTQHPGRLHACGVLFFFLFVAMVWRDIPLSGLSQNTLWGVVLPILVTGIISLCASILLFNVSECILDRLMMMRQAAALLCSVVSTARCTAAGAI